jgi:hypothetical protein
MIMRNDADKNLEELKKDNNVQFSLDYGNK